MSAYNIYNISCWFSWKCIITEWIAVIASFVVTVNRKDLPICDTKRTYWKIFAFFRVCFASRKIGLFCFTIIILLKLMLFYCAQSIKSNLWLCAIYQKLSWAILALGVAAVSRLKSCRDGQKPLHEGPKSHLPIKPQHFVSSLSEQQFADTQDHYEEHKTDSEIILYNSPLPFKKKKTHTVLIFPSVSIKMQRS